MILLSNVLSRAVGRYCASTGAYRPVRTSSPECWGPPTYNRVHDQTAGVGRITRYEWGDAANGERGSADQLRSTATSQQAPVTGPIASSNCYFGRWRSLGRLTSNQQTITPCGGVDD